MLKRAAWVLKKILKNINFPSEKIYNVPSKIKYVQNKVIKDNDRCSEYKYGANKCSIIYR